MRWSEVESRLNMDYQYYNDYELLFLLEENDEIARMIFTRKYRPLVYEEAKIYYNRIKMEDLEGLSFAELVSLGDQALERARLSFNDNKGALFYTYFIVCLRSSFHLYYRGLKAKKNQMFFTYDEKDYQVEDAISFETKWKNNPLSICEKHEQEEKIFEFMLDLDGFERHVFELRYHGFKYHEIATLLSSTTNQVGKCLQKLRKMLKKKLKNISI